MPVSVPNVVPGVFTLEAAEAIEHVVRQPVVAEEQTVASCSIDKDIPWRLFASHFLSTWNSRSFEFAATLFLASIYPHTLQPLSVYALVRSASAILFASSIGQVIDKRARLPVVRFSIVAGRTAVILSAIGFWALYTYRSLKTSERQGMFAALILLSCLEKIASVMNLVSVERDWVVVVARGNEPVLQKLNARMRRIDLFCKLAGPLVIALIDGASTDVAIWLTFGTNIISMPLEYYLIAKVFKLDPGLQAPRNATTTEELAMAELSTQASNSTPLGDRNLLVRLSHAWQGIHQWTRTLLSTFKLYFHHPAFLPSFSLSLLYLTVLSLSGQQITYLLSSGFTAFTIALVRTLSVAFELSATWIAPRVMLRIGPLRAGMWFLSAQMLCLGATVAFFWGEHTAIIAASALVGGTILSRIGLWGYDLSAQVIVQTEVREQDRGSFSTTEAAFQNLFELLSYALTIALPRPDEFRWPVLISAAAVYVAGLLYGVFLRRRRGHLLHVPCGKPRLDDE